MKDQIELLLELGTEGGTLSIQRFRTPDGTWKFVCSTDESAMADFLDEEDQIELFHEYPPVDSFEKALQLLDKYSWHKMHVITVHEQYADILNTEKKKRLIAEGKSPAERDGPLTQAVAEYLVEELHEIGLLVYSDHGGKGVCKGKIVSALKENYKTADELAHLDIAVASKTTNQIIALIEIEETTNKPKTLLSDIFGTLMGNFISLPGKPKSGIGNFTTLIIMANGKGHDDRNKYICEKAMAAKSVLGTGSSTIGDIVIQSFADYQELKEVLTAEIRRANRIATTTE